MRSQQIFAWWWPMILTMEYRAVGIQCLWLRTHIFSLLSYRIWFLSSFSISNKIRNNSRGLSHSLALSFSRSPCQWIRVRVFSTYKMYQTSACNTGQRLTEIGIGNWDNWHKNDRFDTVAMTYAFASSHCSLERIFGSVTQNGRDRVAFGIWWVRAWMLDSDNFTIQHCLRL